LAARQQVGSAVVFAAFDVLAVGDQEVMAEPWTDRLKRLEDIFPRAAIDARRLTAGRVTGAPDADGLASSTTGRRPAVPDIRSGGARAIPGAREASHRPCWWLRDGRDHHGDGRLVELSRSQRRDPSLLPLLLLDWPV
jgi:hypothetical protein